MPSTSLPRTPSLACLESNSLSGAEDRTKSTGWKWDVDIYDRPGWNSFTYQFPIWGGIKKGANNEVLIRFDTADANAINDDFYFEHYRQVVLSSKDGGKRWKEIDVDWKSRIAPIELSDGTFVQIIYKSKLLTRKQQKERLEELGIGHTWRDDCSLNWDFWPKEMAKELKEQGLAVWDKETEPSPGYRYLPEGVVATHPKSDLVVRRSIDQGRTWQQKDLNVSMDGFGRADLCSPGSVVLPDDTILVPFCRQKKIKAPSGEVTLERCGVSVLRSEDNGQTWQIIEIGTGEAGAVTSETTLVYHPSGRVISIMRSGGADGQVHCSVSDDGGKTWTAPKRTGISNISCPLSGICLNSGNILCVYNRRDFPAGVRAALSYDRGESWDVANEKILRDDVLPSSYIGGPGSVQLDDGSIFTFYSIVKVVTPGEKDKTDRDQPLVLNPGFHQYISGSRYTEDYIKPLGG